MVLLLLRTPCSSPLAPLVAVRQSQLNGLGPLLGTLRISPLQQQQQQTGDLFQVRLVTCWCTAHCMFLNPLPI
jgi:hypothetical protein